MGAQKKDEQKGEVCRHKARLVARGFAQREFDSFHPDEVFAHVVDRNSLRTVLSLAASKDLKVYSFDISNAYLQADLKETIYMEPPPGMTLNEGECLALDKAIYGTKNGARAFSDVLDARLEEIGFTRSIADPCIWCGIDLTGFWGKTQKIQKSRFPFAFASVISIFNCIFWVLPQNPVKSIPHEKRN